MLLTYQIHENKLRAVFVGELFGFFEYICFLDLYSIRVQLVSFVKNFTIQNEEEREDHYGDSSTKGSLHCATINIVPDLSSHKGRTFSWLDMKKLCHPQKNNRDKTQKSCN